MQEVNKVMKLLDKISAGQVYTIAEMSANHAGDIKNAFAIIEQAKLAGADCIKIQTYTADTMTIDCDNEYFRIKDGLWDGRFLYELYKEAYTPWAWQKEIKEKCEEMEIDFLSTPFDCSAVDFLEELEVEAYKIASFEIVDIPLIEYVASKKKPMILSCGMASVEEIGEAINACYKYNNKNIILLKCCSEYPSFFEDMNLLTIQDLQERFKLPVGISDHSLGSIAAIVGVSLGACVVEKHFCLDRAIKNPDSSFSMEPSEFKSMIVDIKKAETILGNVSYEPSEVEKQSLIFRRSIFAIKDIPWGVPFTKENVQVIRPGYGLKPKYYNHLLGKIAQRNINRGDIILHSDLE